ncbi:secretory calcium-binding phosphoprotein 9 [Neolamprologus brichardi]|uniref:secretory calcium-binding phosphoprotein 9 n=1 Tax=Neolamprologus brichardi TaxID=32507 RepID=UPI001643B7FF|nr:secretory calcium-binding phosphoprotein 9 [Neolamprologus brichardi]
MKLFLFAAFVATLSYSFSCSMQTARLLAAMNAGMLNGGLLNGGLLNGANPGMLVGGLNPPIVAGGGAGVIGQPQFAQFVPRVPAFVVPAQVGNVYPFPAVPAVNAYQVPFMGVPQMAPMNAPQQPAMGNPAGAAPQQLPVQPDPLGRFRRQIIKAENTVKSTVDTQIPSSAPSASPTAAPCNKDI